MTALVPAAPAPPPVLDQEALVALARDIAQEMLDLDEILVKHKLTDTQYEIIKVNPFFSRVLAAETACWHSPLNTAERTKLKASLLVEDLLPALNTRLHDRKESLEDMLKGAATLMKIAGIGERAPAANGDAKPGEKFVIQINMGAEQQLTYSKDIALTPPTKPGETNDHAPPIDLFLDPPSSGNFFLGGD